jgi:hypothetical protein
MADVDTSVDSSSTSHTESALYSFARNLTDADLAQLSVALDEERATRSRLSGRVPLPPGFSRGPAKRRRPSPEDAPNLCRTDTLFIDDLVSFPTIPEKQRLAEVLSHHAELTRLNVRLLDGRAVAFATFTSVEGATRCRHAVNGLKLGGSFLRVRFATTHVPDVRRFARASVARSEA